jgi:hypothetical protein
VPYDRRRKDPGSPRTATDLQDAPLEAVTVGVTPRYREDLQDGVFARGQRDGLLGRPARGLAQIGRQ